MRSELIVPILRALFPFLLSVLAATGVGASVTVVVDNIGTILMAVGAISAAFPSLKAAWKYKHQAD